jgi:valyl-tRNA synthetase
MNVDRAEQAGVWSLAEFTARMAASASGAGALTPDIAEFIPATLEDRWILSRFNHIAEDVGAALQSHRFHDAANRVYDFFWGEFCDWYIELIKPRLSVENAPDPATQRTAFQNVVSIFEAALRLLHPFMPFITEEIWHAVYDGKPLVKSIALANYPAAAKEQIIAAAEREMAILQELIVTVRNTRAELKIEPRQRVPIEIHAASAVRALIEQNATSLQRLATVDAVRFVETSLANLPGARTTPNFEVHVVYQRSADAATERDRLTKELERMEQEIGNAQRQLGNESFLSKAPAHVVAGLRKRAQELETLRAKARGALAELQ